MGTGLGLVQGPAGRFSAPSLRSSPRSLADSPDAPSHQRPSHQRSGHRCHDGGPLASCHRSSRDRSRWPPSPVPSPPEQPPAAAAQIRQARAPLHQLPHGGPVPQRCRAGGSGGPAGPPQRGAPFALRACALLPPCLLVLRLHPHHHPTGLEGGGPLPEIPATGVGADRRLVAPAAAPGPVALGRRHAQLPQRRGAEPALEFGHPPFRSGARVGGLD